MATNTAHVPPIPPTQSVVLLNATYSPTTATKRIPPTQSVVPSYPTYPAAAFFINSHSFFVVLRFLTVMS